MKVTKYKIWKVIKITNKPIPKLIEKLEKDNVYVSSYAKEIASQIETSKPEEVSLVLITLSDWFNENPTTEEIYSKAKLKGLELCPASTGIHLRLNYKEQMEGEWIYVGMNPITDSGGIPYVFYVKRDIGGKRWLDAFWVRPDDQWALGYRLVFRLRKLPLPSNTKKLEVSHLDSETLGHSEPKKDMKVTKKISEICSYQGSNFKEWFGDMEYPKEEAVKLFSKKLSRSMNDNEILSELKPTEVSIVDIFDTLKTLDKSVWGIFYCKDNTGVLRAVRVDWYDGGWYVIADSVGSPCSWDAGSQVFSRNSFDSLSSDTQSLSPSEPSKDIRLVDEFKKINDKLDNIIKYLKIK